MTASIRGRETTGSTAWAITCLTLLSALLTLLLPLSLYQIKETLCLLLFGHDHPHTNWSLTQSVTVLILWEKGMVSADSDGGGNSSSCIFGGIIGAVKTEFYLAI